MYLLIGASGMLGSSFIEELARYGSPRLLAPSHAELDITDETSVFKYFADHKPTIVINCAAARNVDWCESNPQEAFKQNAHAVGLIARAARDNRASLYHISTEYVFDGEKDGLYTELDETNPINVYGASKLFGEKNAIKYGATVLRVQWLYGATKSNFIQWLASVIRSGMRASITNAQIGCPMSTSWVAHVVLLSIAKQVSPAIYHVSHDDFCSRLEVAEAVCAYFGSKVSDHFDVITDTNFGTARRPVNSRMSNAKLRAALNITSLGGWQEDLNYYLSKVYPK